MYTKTVKADYPIKQFKSKKYVEQDNMYFFLQHSLPLFLSYKGVTDDNDDDGLFYRKSKMTT